MTDGLLKCKELQNKCPDHIWSYAVDLVVHQVYNTYSMAFHFIPIPITSLKGAALII